MQKKIIALAVAAVASGAAFAQTNVTISGNLNYQLENIQGSNPSDAQATNAQKTGREGRNRVNENGSEIVFKVTEDLGNGLKANVVVASGIQPTDSTTGNSVGIGSGGQGSRGAIGSRDSYIGLSGKFGEIRAGRQTVHYNSQGTVDSFGSGTGLAASSLAVLHGIGGSTPNLTAGGAGTAALAGYGIAAGGRFGSSLSYITPNLNGMSATFGYARPNTTGTTTDGVVNAVAAQSSYSKESNWSIKGNFDNGPISAFLAYSAHSDISLRNTGLTFSNATNQSTILTVAATGIVTVAATAGVPTAYVAATHSLAGWIGEVRGARMGASYTFPMGLKVGMIYDNTKFLAKDTTAANNFDYTAKRTAWVIPMSWAFGSHTVGATYGKANNVQVGGTVGTQAAAGCTAIAAGVCTTVTSNSQADFGNTGARYWMMGYQYAFSKRTNVGLTYARIDNDSRAAYDFFSNSAMGMASILRGSDPTTVQLGLKHSF